MNERWQFQRRENMTRRTYDSCLALTVTLALVIAVIGLPGVHAQVTHRVGLVVYLGDGSLITRCVEFSEPQISGYEVLMRSGLNVLATFNFGMGAAICSIEGTGCPVEECLTCDQPNYWAYWHLIDGSWAYSRVGASSYTVRHGDVEGWTWESDGPPSIVPFDQICAPPLTDTPSPTNTPLPPTDTPPPATVTPLPPTNTPPPTPGTVSPPLTPMVWLRLDANPIPIGSCTTVRWDTSNALEVYLDGECVGPNGEHEVCPTTSQEYHLRVVGKTGEQIHTLTLGVTGTPHSALTTAQPGTPLPSSPAPTSQRSATTTPMPPYRTSPPTPMVPTPPSPSPTSNYWVALPVSATPTRAIQPTLTPSPTSGSPHSSGDGQQAASDGKHTTSRVLLGYIAFDLLVAGLIGWMIVGIRRRR
jgi:hypothetical protein